MADCGRFDADQLALPIQETLGRRLHSFAPETGQIDIAIQGGCPPRIAAAQRYPDDILVIEFLHQFVQKFICQANCLLFLNAIHGGSFEFAQGFSPRSLFLWFCKRNNYRSSRVEVSILG
jgi:hypothetical protein